MKCDRQLITPAINSSILKYQVIGNILGNAIKFSHPGGVIKVDAYEERGEICISVRDEGIGIPKKIYDSLFAWSKGSHRKGTKGELGTGFGLPIVKRIVELHEGCIDIESPTNQRNQLGTHVKVSFKAPLKTSD